MIIQVVAAAVLSLAAAGQDAPAATPQTPVRVADVMTSATPAAPVATSPEERVVCRRERGIGSNRSERVCTTVADRAEARANTRQFLERSADPSEPTSFPSGHSLE